MGTDRRVRGHPTRRLGPAVVLTALAAMLLAAPNALAGLYTVNSTLDTPGACTLSFCTLRQAVEAANLDPGSAITFQIGIGGSYTFLPATPLPDITQSVTIDATTQTGYAGAPLIQLDGSSAGSGAAGLRATGGSATIRGLAVVEFDGSGIAFSGSSNGNIVTGNYIGIGSGASVARGNGTGIHVAASNTLIGGSGAARNVVSGNLFNGINIAGSSNTVRGNYVGLDASGNFAVPNLRGVVVSSDTNVIGGSDTARNVISGNTMQGVAIARASVNTVSENYIGTDATGVTAVPNGGAGVVIDGGDTGANTNTIGTNVISGNGGPGVLITTASGGAGNNT